MQITLNQDEIEVAIESYVANQVSLRPNQKISVDLRAGRGENGFTATLDIRAAGVQTKQASGLRTPVARTIEQEPPTEPQPADPEPAPEPIQEPAPKPVAAKGGKRGIFAATKTTEPEPEPEPEQAEEDIPDEETPEQEEARREEAEATNGGGDDASEAPAPKKGSIFNLSNRKAAG